MADFTIPGDPGALRASAVSLRGLAARLETTAMSMRRLSTDGWEGAAGDAFRGAFTPEPRRWEQAADGFASAADALDAHAATLEWAQGRARECERAFTAAVTTSEQARHAHEADQALLRPSAYRQPLLPVADDFVDPGAAGRAAAEEDFREVQDAVEASGERAAATVRAACDAAPSKPGWFSRNVGSFFLGAGESLWDLGKMVLWDLNPQAQLGWAAVRVATGQATVGEVADEFQDKGEALGAIAKAAYDDPDGFALNVGKSLIDLETWQDDPARALGHLVPDAIAAVATGGAGAGAKALRALDGVHDVAMWERPLHGLRTLRGTDALDLAGLGKLDDAALARHLDEIGPSGQSLLLRRGEDYHLGSMADTFGPSRGPTDFADPGIAKSFADRPAAVSPTSTVDGPMVNLHPSDRSGSGTFWAEPDEMLRMRSEEQARDSFALLDDWDTVDGVRASRDEITLREFSAGEPQRMQVGQVGPQPVHEPGVPAPTTVDERPGGGTQYVVGREAPAYDAEVPTWTGPPPWVERADGDWGGFAAGAGAGLAATSAPQLVPADAGTVR